MDKNTALIARKFHQAFGYNVQEESYYINMECYKGEYLLGSMNRVLDRKFNLYGETFKKAWNKVLEMDFEDFQHGCLKDKFDKRNKNWF